MGEEVVETACEAQDTRRYLGEMGAAHQTRQGSRSFFPVPFPRVISMGAHAYQTGTKRTHKRAHDVWVKIYFPPRCVLALVIYA